MRCVNNYSTLFLAFRATTVTYSTVHRTNIYVQFKSEYFLENCRVLNKIPQSSSDANFVSCDKIAFSANPRHTSSMSIIKQQPCDAFFVFFTFKLSYSPTIIFFLKIRVSLFTVSYTITELGIKLRMVFYVCTGAFLYAPSSYSLISNKFRRFY